MSEDTLCSIVIEKDWKQASCLLRGSNKSWHSCMVGILAALEKLSLTYRHQKGLLSKIYCKWKQLDAE